MIRMGRAVDWMFRNRETGRITIVQFPNVPLGVFIVASILSAVAHPAGTAGVVLRVIATGALVVWAVVEVIRGVNPWRRLLGGGVLVWGAVRLAVG